MLRLSRKAFFALAAVLDIACHSGGQPVQSQEINQRQGIPRRYLEQALQGLVRSGILYGVRGPRGGYRLARERRRISVGEIVRAIRDMEEGDSHDLFPDSALGQALVRPLWDSLQDELMRRLDTVSVDELCTRAWRGGIIDGVAGDTDFII